MDLGLESSSRAPHRGPQYIERSRGPSLVSGIEEVLGKLASLVHQRPCLSTEESSATKRSKLNKLQRRHTSASHRRSDWRFLVLEDMATWEELLEQGIPYEEVVRRLSSYHQNVALLAAFMSAAVCSTLFDREWNFEGNLEEV